MKYTYSLTTIVAGVSLTSSCTSSGEAVLQARKLLESGNTVMLQRHPSKGT